MGSNAPVLPGADSLTTFWIPIETRTVLRAAWLGAVWAFVAAVVAGVAVAALTLVGAAVTAIVGLFGESISLSETTRRTTLIGGGIAASGAIAASTWAAAYASTQTGSRWRMLAGSAVGVAFGLGLVGVGSLGAAAAALAAGWGMAIPSDRMGRAALRAVPMALVALLPVFQAQDGWLEWLIAGVAGVVVAWLWIAIAEGLWSIFRNLSCRLFGPPAIMQSKTQPAVIDNRTKESTAVISQDDENAEEEPWRTSI